MSAVKVRHLDGSQPSTRGGGVYTLCGRFISWTKLNALVGHSTRPCKRCAAVEESRRPSFPTSHHVDEDPERSMQEDAVCW